MRGYQRKIFGSVTLGNLDTLILLIDIYEIEGAVNHAGG